MTDPATWQLCVAVLTSVGHKETVARALIGRWLGEWEEADVVAAVEAAAGRVDPVAYARKILQSKPTKRRKEQDQLPLMPESTPASRDVARAAIKQGINVLKGRV